MKAKKFVLATTAVLLPVLAAGTALFLSRGQNTAKHPRVLRSLLFPSYLDEKGNIIQPNDGPANGGDRLQTGSHQEACSLFNTMVRETAAEANFCTTDDDCRVQVHSVCALGCEYLYNRTVNINSILSAATIFQEQRCPECPKFCVTRKPEASVCKRGVCVIR